jgi:Fe-Mn family superoxide dismutase
MNKYLYFKTGVKGMSRAAYKAKNFNLSGLQGISDQTIEAHFALYQGYVKNTNLLNEQIMEMVHSGQASGKDLIYAELTRRLGFEYGGMVLHEYYFENLFPKGRGRLSADAQTYFANSFGDVAAWKQAFAAVGEMRGVGWAILYQDPVTEQLSNHWVALHQDGVPSGFKPILVMDVWEHAFVLDYSPSGRSKYISAFFANVDWEVVNSRLRNPAAARAVA